MMPDPLNALLRTGLILTASGLVAWGMLRITRCRSAQVHRVVWGIVLLQGVLWIRIPIELAVLAPKLSLPDTTSKTVTASSDIVTVPKTAAAWPAMRSVKAPAQETVTGNAVSEMNGVTGKGLDTSNALSGHSAALRSRLLLVLWLAIMCVVLMTRIISAMRVYRQLRTAVPATGRDLAEWQGEISHKDAKKTKIAKFFKNSLRPLFALRLCVKSPRMFITERLGPALIWLPAGWCVLVPKPLWEESNEPVRRGILRHELSHYRHRDGVKSLLMFLIAALHWFNPVAWFALKKFSDAAEWRCDLEAYGNEPDAVAAFAESMLVLHKTADRYVAFLPAFKSRDLKERIQRLKDHQTGKKESNMKKLLITGLATLLLCCGGIKISLVAQPATEKLPKETPAVQSESPSAEQPAAKTENTVKNLDPEKVTIKGKAVFPDGTPAKRCDFVIAGPGTLILSTGFEMDDQGNFAVQTPPSERYRMAILDPQGEWATPVQTFAWEEGKELIFEFEKGVKIEGTVRDEKTGQPIPKMEIMLLGFDENKKRDPIFFLRDCDDDGHYSFRVVPQGEYYVTVGVDEAFVYSHDQYDASYPYGKKAAFDGGNDVVVDFSIPSPFVGRVLRVDGSPAPDMTVIIYNDEPSLDSQFYFATTDQEGRFRTAKRPKNVGVKFLSRSISNESYINWFDDDLPVGGEVVFQLRPSCQIKGRLIDAATGEPMSNQRIFAGYSDKDRPERKESSPIDVTTDAHGDFSFDKILAGIRYNLYLVPGRQESYDGGPLEPVVEVATVIPENDGKTVELGEITLDLTNVKTRAVSEEQRAGKRMDNIMRISGNDDNDVMNKVQRWKSKLKNGEIKAVLWGYALREYHESLMKQLENEKEQLASFQIDIEIPENICPEDKLTELLNKYNDFPKMELIVLTLENAIAINFSQLRGEKDSPWNVAADDPSNDPSSLGEWKNSPTGINPKILENFLRNCLGKRP
ncbi:MAG: M56 family metallopeptidase [Planctomycetaceae bacterium]|nr:M56 family metallopeptidase [Planctomycetaceae bacterium]